jgi:hypothetical protein
MTDRTEVLVFDTGPLSHFARQGWLESCSAARHGVHSGPQVQPAPICWESVPGGWYERRGCGSIATMTASAVIIIDQRAG